MRADRIETRGPILSKKKIRRSPRSRRRLAHRSASSDSSERCPILARSEASTDSYDRSETVYHRVVPGIGLITNPRSRLNRRDPARLRRLGYLIGSHGLAEATRSLDDLYRVCEEFKRERIEILGISGGDGTLHHTLTAVIRTYENQPLPLIAILRGGTMNTVANSFGIKGSTPKLLFELVDKHRRGLTHELDIFEHEILQVGDRYGFIFGNGVIYNFLHEYYATQHPSPATAAQLVARGALSTIVSGPLAHRLYRRFQARVIVDGDPWARQDFATVAASVVEQIGLGFRPFYRIHDQPGTFAILGIHASAFGFVSELGRIFTGRPMRRDKVIDAVAREALFESEHPLEYTIDGDTYVAEGQLLLRSGPRLRFIRLTGDAVGEASLPELPVENSERNDSLNFT
jgi:diacylglycerol kinase (ATP)